MLILGVVGGKQYLIRQKPVPVLITQHFILNICLGRDLHTNIYILLSNIYDLLSNI